jgi:hypothetical protein
MLLDSSSYILLFWTTAPDVVSSQDRAGGPTLTLPQSSKALVDFKGGGQ